MRNEIEPRLGSQQGFYAGTASLLHGLRLVAAIFMTLLLSACAGAQLTQHGIQPEVRGQTPVYDIQVLYGEKVINFRGRRPPGSGGGWNAPMPVPEAMTVKWTVDGVRQEVTIPLRDKVDPLHSIENWILIFDGTKLELVRQVLLAPPSTPTGARPRAEVKVFP